MATHTEQSVEREVLRVTTICPACRETVFGAEGEGFCRDCFITFPLARQSRSEMLKHFAIKYYTSKQGAFYHRAGCKYLKSISSANLVELAEPFGRPCRCVRE